MPKHSIKLLLFIMITLLCAPLNAASSYTVKAKKTFSDSRGTLYIIQDIHADFATQLSIAELIEALSATGTAHVFLEGTVGQIDFDWFKTFPDQMIRDMVAFHSMKNGKINGAEYTAITSPNTFSLYGVDDASLYKKNLNFLKQNLANDGANITFVTNLKAKVSKIVGNIDDPSLRSLKEITDSANGENVIEYFKAFFSFLEKNGISIPENSYAQSLIKNYAYLDGVDPASLETQKLTLIKALAQKNKDSVKHLLSSLNDYETIHSLIRQYEKYHFDLNKINLLKEYTSRVAALSIIPYNGLQEELIGFQRSYLDSLPVSSPSQILSAVLFCIPLIENYFHSALTRDEYDFLLYCLGTIKATSFKYGTYASLSHHFEQFFLAVSADNFYQSAIQRDHVIAQKTIEHILSAPNTTNILVVGGFHIAGICGMLDAHKISYEIILPDVSRKESLSHYLHTYYSRLGIKQETIPVHFIQKAQDILSFRMAHLAVTTFLKHILSDTESPNFMLETQFLMQGLHIFFNNADVTLDSYPSKQLSFMPPILIGDTQMYPVTFADNSIPPLFVTIAHHGQTPSIQVPRTLHSDDVSNFHFAVSGPDSVRELFRDTDAAISFSHLDYESQRILAQNVYPFFQTQQDEQRLLVESLFMEFDPFIQFRQYSIGGLNNTLNELLSPTTAAIYKNGPTFLGILDRSGPSMEKLDEYRLRDTINALAEELIGSSSISADHAERFRQTLPFIYDVRSDTTVKYPADFVVNYREFGKNTGDLHYRYYERFTEADLKGLVLRLFQETTGYTGNPLEQRNTESLVTNLSKTRDFFSKWDKQLDFKHLIELSPFAESLFAQDNAELASRSPQAQLALLSERLAINDTQILESKIAGSNVPYVFLPSLSSLAFDLKVWGETILLKRIQEMFAQHNITLPENSTAETILSLLEQHPEISAKIQPVTFFAKDASQLDDVSQADITLLLNDPFFAALNAFHKYGLFQMHAYHAPSLGFSVTQMPDATQEILRSIQNSNGFLITRGETNYFSVNLLNIHSIRLAQIKTEPVKEYLSIETGDSLIQYVPAGLAPVIGFGFTQQSARQFTDALQSEAYARLTRLYDGNEEYALAKIREKFHKTYLPVHRIIDSLLDPEAYDYGIVRATREVKVLPDGYTNFVNMVTLPGAGMLKMDIWRAENPQGDTLEDIKRKYEELYPNRQMLLLTNGGFFITSAIAKRESLPEEVVGTNLGLSIREGKILSPPLFNKGAIFQTDDGRIIIRRATINRHGGIWDSRYSSDQGLFWEDGTINLNPETLESQSEVLKDKILLYTPLYDSPAIPQPALKGRVLMHVVGNKVTHIEKEPSQMRNLICGICLAIPIAVFERQKAFFEAGSIVDFRLDLGEDLKNINTALESGPFLIKDGKIDFKEGTDELNMEEGGWLTENSKKTQASDVHDQIIRSARIAAGVKDDTLIMVAVDSRIQESMGAGHKEMAHLMHELGVEFATEYDGGSSVSLFLPHLSDPVLTNSSWSGNAEPPYIYPRYPRWSGARPLISALIYYIDKKDMPKLELRKKIELHNLSVIEQSM
ncbi:phosphodiester glycosidase family protein [bacterium]|nr:phosphodiester glycosidase family protein [bacterium]